MPQLRLIDFGGNVCMRLGRDAPQSVVEETLPIQARVSASGNLMKNKIDAQL